MKELKPRKPEFIRGWEACEKRLNEEIEKLKPTPTTQAMSLKWLKGYNGALSDIQSLLEAKK